jgi:hypothetical protein
MRSEHHSCVDAAQLEKARDELEELVAKRETAAATGFAGKRSQKASTKSKPSRTVTEDGMVLQEETEQGVAAPGTRKPSVAVAVSVETAKLLTPAEQSKLASLAAARCGGRCVLVGGRF